VTWVKLTILSTALANSSLLFLIIPTLASALLPWIDSMVASPQRGSGDQVSLMKSPQEEGGGGGAEGGEGTGTELRHLWEQEKTKQFSGRMKYQNFKTKFDQLMEGKYADR
jgi:hypothetical protein